MFMNRFDVLMLKISFFKKNIFFDAFLSKKIFEKHPQPQPRFQIPF
jgi:hypothetical protein